ncbi:MAG: transcriptional repressor [Desulfatibacillaceae bacterium]
MERTHNQEIEQFRKLFCDQGIDRVEDRVSILETFLSTEEHITAEQLYAMLKSAGYDLEDEFVRETLRLMCRYGFAEKRTFENHEGREAMYEHRHLGQHHDHLICTKCGAITEFADDELERLQAEVAARTGFHMLAHRMELYGICPSCLAERQGRMSLLSARRGEQVVVREQSGGAGARMRLLSMGIRVDDVLEVITNNGAGQVVVAVDGKRYALGRGLADKILVEPLEHGGAACG